ncbi:RNase A-like domain-containing protein [Nitrobacter sp. 62-13]|mgnify:FL=1|uniref:RNase A-like domain-containing protein n=1 Tax=Nitrobacter sp. 62-13 TaxID=1895797 RepID=UPI000A58519C|nr:RNase A-like domain-containing protein [Nitrobacter sp. 62-13]
MRSIRRFKFNPDQPRVPAGNPDGGQWTDGGGRLEQIQQRPNNRPIDLLEERDLGGHAIERHVGRSEASLLNGVNSAASYARRNGWADGLSESSFPSLEAANKLVNSTVARNPDKVDKVVNGLSGRENLDAVFGSPTGTEAYAATERSQPYIRETYGVRVVIVPDRRSTKGYRVETAFPKNE